VDGEEVVEMWKVKEWAVLLRVVWLKDPYWERRKAKCWGQESSESKYNMRDVL
jgi:hypothetical protein